MVHEVAPVVRAQQLDDAVAKLETLVNSTEATDTAKVAAWTAIVGARTALVNLGNGQPLRKR
jgi:hypothetical protein